MTDLDLAIRAAAEAWPGLSVEPEAFRKHLGKAQKLEHVADLYLAFACARRDDTAIEALDSLLAAEVPRALARLGQSAAFTSDVRQVLLEKLVVAPTPKIGSYSGRGALKPWLRSAALRAALDLLKTRRPEQSLDEGAAPRGGGVDPELALLRRRYAGPLKAAVESALRALEVDERNVLRFYFLEAMTVEEIATLRGIHKSNVSRLISRTRRKVLEEAKRTLSREHGIAPVELESVIRLLHSQLHVSIERALGASRA